MWFKSGRVRVTALGRGSKDDHVQGVNQSETERVTSEVWVRSGPRGVSHLSGQGLREKSLLGCKSGHRYEGGTAGVLVWRRVLPGRETTAGLWVKAFGGDCRG